MEPERALRRTNVLLRRLGRALSALINRATLYRFTDDALLLSSALAGIVVGLAIVVFHKVLELFELGWRMLSPEAWQATGIDHLSWTTLLVPLITAAGGFVVGLLKRSVLFRDVHHHGLHSVSESLSEKASPLTWKHSLHAMILSSVSIASGGGAGREAPTVILGSSVASGLARLGQLDRRHIRVLGAAGAAAAISGIFNAPLGGILFSVEAITGELRARTFLPIVIASVLATTTVRTILGNDPLLVAPLEHSVSLIDYPLLAIAGICSAFIAAYYLRTYKSTYKHAAHRLQRIPELARPALGGLLAGLPLMVLPWLLETTYRPINMALSGSMNPTWWVGLLLATATIVLKPITNAITLASGGEGGTLAPAMKVGALFGFVLGTLLSLILPDTSVGLYAIVCAGAVLSGSFRAPLTGGLLLFEVSGNYELLLPLLFSAVVSVYIIRRLRVTTFNPLDDLDRHVPGTAQQAVHQSDVPG